MADKSTAGEATRPPSPASAPKQFERPADKALHAPIEDKGWPRPQADRQPPRRP